MKKGSYEGWTALGLVAAAVATIAVGRELALRRPTPRITVRPLHGPAFSLTPRRRGEHLGRALLGVLPYLEAGVPVPARAAARVLGELDAPSRLRFRNATAQYNWAAAAGESSDSLS